MCKTGRISPQRRESRLNDGNLTSLPETLGIRAGFDQELTSETDEKSGKEQKPLSQP